MITYFVLKADGGKTAGCVRLENGRARSSCPCTLLLEDGAALDIGPEETPLPAKAIGAAVLQGEKPTAWGTAPGTDLTGSELLRRLRQARTASVPPEPEPLPAPEPVPEPEPEPEPEPVPEPADSAALAADFGLLVKHAGEVYDDILHPPLPEEVSPPAAEAPKEPVEKPRPQGDWFSETDELLSRFHRR